MVKETTDKPRRVGDGTPGPGRPKGGHNKATKALKEMILAALDGVGGVDYLQSQASENPTAFLTLVGKVLPLTVAGDKENPLEVTTRVVNELVRPARTDG